MKVLLTSLQSLMTLLMMKMEMIKQKRKVTIKVTMTEKTLNLKVK
jgi:hypothetical protein